MKTLLLTLTLCLFATQSFAANKVLEGSASCVSTKKAFAVTSKNQGSTLDECAKNKAIDNAADECINRYGRVLEGEAIATGCTREILDINGSLMMHMKCSAKAAVLCNY